MNNWDWLKFEDRKGFYSQHLPNKILKEQRLSKEIRSVVVINHVN